MRWPASLSPQSSCSPLVIRITLSYTDSNERSNYRQGDMGSPSTATRVSVRRHRKAPAPVTRYYRRLAEILTPATEVFCKKGYEGASMRDLSRASGMSLACLYYYFESKERLLYLIQKHTFDIVLRSARERLASTSDPEQRVRSFIYNHIEYFLKNRKAMTVMSHEDETLTGEFGKEI